MGRDPRKPRELREVIDKFPEFPGYRRGLWKAVQAAFNRSPRL